MKRYKVIYKESNAISAFSPGQQIATVSGKDLAVLDAKIAYDMYAATYGKKAVNPQDDGPKEVEINPMTGGQDSYIQSGSITVAKQDLVKADKSKIKSKNWFEKRYPLWTFFGNAQGYVAVRKQNSGAVRINLIAGDKNIVLRAFIELLTKGWPLWSTVDSEVAKLLKNPKVGFIELSPRLVTMLYGEKTYSQSPLIPHMIMGDDKIDDNGDGSLTIHDKELGSLVKYILVNKEWMALTLKLAIQQKWPQEVIAELGGGQANLPGQQLQLQGFRRNKNMRNRTGMREGLRTNRMSMGEARVMTVAQFVAKHFRNTPKFVNYGDVNFVEYGGTQIKIGGGPNDKYIEFSDLSTPDSGYPGWILQSGMIHFAEIFSNYDLTLPITNLQFSPKLSGCISFVGAEGTIEDFYQTGNDKDLASAIISIILGLGAYGGYSDVDREWNYEQEGIEEEEMMLEVERVLKNWGYDVD
jgi:hypothetical protein